MTKNTRLLSINRTKSQKNLHRSIAAIGIAAMSILGISACNNSSDETSDAVTSSEASSGELSFNEGYCKATNEANPSMTACFGLFENGSDEELHITGFSIEELSDKTEFQTHEVVDGQMKETEDGFTIPAGGSLELAPGGLHMMLMNMDTQLEPGQELTVDFHIEGNDDYTVTVPVREQASGEENYGG